MAVTYLVLADGSVHTGEAFGAVVMLMAKWYLIQV